MSLLTDIAAVLNATPGIEFTTGMFETGCKNRLAQSDDYLVLLPLNTATISYDDQPAIEVQNARLTIYSSADWTPIESTLFRAFIAAGLYVTNREYAGYVIDEKRHAYEIELAKHYPIININNENENNERGER